MKPATKTTTHKPAETAAIEQYATALEKKARTRVTPEAGDELEDPQVLHRRAEALVNELEREAQDQEEQRQRNSTYASALLTIPGTDLPWSAVFPILLDRSRHAVAAPGARLAVGNGDPEPLKKAFGDCEAVRNRVIQACGGSDARSPEAVARRQAVFNRPPFTPSKPSWENELRSIVIAIEAKGVHQTPALLALVPKVRGSLATLDKVQPVSGGRPSKKARWSDAVVVAQGTVALAIDELVQWAGAVAPDARNAAILRITNPRRRAEEAPSEPPKDGEPPAKPPADAAAKPDPVVP